jgi:DNA-binding NarL/FixJ family response regulator
MFRSELMDRSSRTTVLTERERDVLDLLAGGSTNNEIADSLVVSLATAKAHVRNILTKLNVRNRAQAAARAGRAWQAGE